MLLNSERCFIIIPFVVQILIQNLILFNNLSRNKLSEPNVITLLPYLNDVNLNKVVVRVVRVSFSTKVDDENKVFE